MARRYRVSGFDESKIHEFESLPKILDALKNEADQHIYILATYTAMLEMRELLAQNKMIGKEMH